MPNDSDTHFPTRRAVLTGGVALLLLPLLPGSAQALTAAEARVLVDRAVADVNRVINSGAAEGAMLREFEGIFSRYADVPTIARSVLGPAARSASQAQLSAFTSAFQGYFTAKYGRRFREFIGGTIVVTDARQVQTVFEVVSTVNMRGERPFELRWLVSDGSGQTRFFNLIIEGVNLLISERTEIGAMLEARRGNVDELIAHLRTLS